MKTHWKAHLRSSAAPTSFAPNSAVRVGMVECLCAPVQSASGWKSGLGLKTRNWSVWNLRKQPRFFAKCIYFILFIFLINKCKCGSSRASHQLPVNLSNILLEVAGGSFSFLWYDITDLPLVMSAGHIRKVQLKLSRQFFSSWFQSGFYGHDTEL